jgi:hypothetical protein
MQVSLYRYYTDPNYNGPGKYWESEEELILVNIPINKHGSRDSVAWRNIIRGDEVQQYVLSFTYNEILIEAYDEQGDKLRVFQGFDWTTSDVPILEVHFYTDKNE